MLFRIVLFLMLMVAGCSSSEPKNSEKEKENNVPDYPNLITLQQPDNRQAGSSKAYIDSVKMIEHNENEALLISGNLANGCTYLEEVSHTSRRDALVLSLKAWKPADKICSQALVPFSYIYKNITGLALSDFSTVHIGEKSFKIEAQ